MGNKHGKGKSANPTRTSRRLESPGLLSTTRTESPDPSETEPSQGFRVWYRHSGEAEIDVIPSPYSISTYLVTDYRTILRTIGDHHITHMHIQPLGDVMPPLDVMSTHLRHLSIGGMSNSHNLDCLKALQNLQVLHVVSSNFSSGLPHVISELTSLIELKLYNCQLSDLPQSVKALQQLQVLHVEYSNFSSGLPHVISELTSLLELKLYDCQLSDLPQSLKALQHLQVLHVEYSNFSSGLPHVIAELTSLIELGLWNCRLSDLPENLSNLKKLEKLDVGWNKFRGRLPPVVYQLDNLRELNLQENENLTEIETDFVKLSKLSLIDCDRCNSLQTPPYAVCEQGLTAITKYFNDLLTEAGTEVTVVPVAVVGNLMAGKTSLILSLKAGKRVLTFRDVSSAKDETTKVFNMESLSLSDALVRFIDFGGHEVYHLAYQLTLKEQCVPLVVVNLEEYQQLSAERGYREATKLLCIDWLSQLYLACPRLGSPILALTHSDRLSVEEFQVCRDQLLESAEEIRLELVKEERELSDGTSDFCQIVHISDLSKPLFDAHQIFLFSKESDVDNAIKYLKECIEKRAVEFKVKVPGLWERISSFIEEQEGEPYVLLSDVKAAFPNTDHIDIVLRYLHNVGKVLWFEDKDSLSQYVFHQIPRIVEMIALLFHHSANEEWSRRIENFTAFRHKNRTVEKATYIQMVEEYKVNGTMDEAILVNLLETSQLLPTKVAIELLKSFCIIHGPIHREQSKAYIIPYLSSKFMGREWKTDKYLQLRADVLFNGLSLPGYVYQLISVTVLNFLSDPTYSVKAANNGATAQHGRSATHLVHDRDNRKVTLQVSTPVELIGPSWKHLIELTQHIISRTCSVWKGTRPEVKFYCAHCLFIRADYPDYKVNPSWFRCAQHTESEGPLSVTTFCGMEPVACTNVELSSQGELTVPKPLRFPCYHLNVVEIAELNTYLSALEERRTLSESGGSTESPHTHSPLEDDDADSECSDIVEEGYADFTRQDIEPFVSDFMQLVPTSKERVRQLFDNQRKVYEMSDPVRGRVMIINNENFYRDDIHLSSQTRDGSYIDYCNILALFKHMDFVVAKERMFDLTRKEILSEISKETRHKDHRHLNMFVLVIMSHGTSGHIFYDTDCQPVHLVEIKDLLSASKFPAMKGKPKLIIFHACSGDRLDLGDAVSRQGTQSPSLPSAASLPPETASSSATVDDTVTPEFDVTKLEHLDADDFYVMKPSTESYQALRHPSYGTWFIRILVATFYKHSCHRDIEELFKMVQDRVRKVSIDYCKKTGDPTGGNVPSRPDCTFTNFRKLMFFPKFHGK